MARLALLALLAMLCLLALVMPAQAITYPGSPDNIAYASVHALGYDGAGVIVGVIDTEIVRADHETFYTASDNTATRVTRVAVYNGNTGTGIGHATAVAGMAAGRGPGDGTYLGVAPRASIWSASTSGKEADIHQALLDFSSPVSNPKPCQIYAMSLASDVSDCGLYVLTLFVDYMASNRNALVAVPAGNSHDKIAVPGGNYNQITVGGLDASGLHAAPTLGQGPTFDGRAKPDILAPATGVYLPSQAGTDTYYQNPGSFTSVAVPFVTGTAALIRQYGDVHGWTWDVRATKAVILNSATKLAGWTHTDTQPLDYQQGAGRLNAEWAIYNYAAGEQAPGTVASRGWDIETASSRSLKKYALNRATKAGDVISATLDWYRWTATTDGNLTGNHWYVSKFENLNLLLYRNSDCAVVAQSVSTIDSVEHIFYHVTGADTYSLVVQLLGTGTRTEVYGLAWNTMVPGDATGDGKIDGGDLAVWQQNYDPLGAKDNVWTMGDWNFDGKVDGGDLALWQQNYDPIGTGLGLGLTSQEVAAMLGVDSVDAAIAALDADLATVPEPATLALSCLGLASLGLLRRRRAREETVSQPQSGVV